MQHKRVSIYSQLSAKYKIPYPVIEVICNSPFKFANRVISDPIDTKSIMFAYLFKFAIKNRFTQDKQLKVIRNYGKR